MNTSMQNGFTCTLFQLVCRVLFQQQDGIVVDLFPEFRINQPKHISHFRIPTPPEISGKPCELFVDRHLGQFLGHGDSFGYVRDFD
jgi:hypothetical protein